MFSFRYSTTVALLFAVASLSSAVDFPEYVDLGIIQESAVAAKSISIDNDGETKVKYELVSSCSCLTVRPKTLRIAAGKSAKIDIQIDPAGYDGEIEKVFLVRPDDPEGERILVTVKAFVDTSAPLVLQDGECGSCKELEHQMRLEYLRSRTAENTVHAEIFFSAGCKSCERLLAKTFPSVEEETGISIDLDKHNILETEGYEYLMARARALGVTINEFPAVFVGTTVLQGERKVRRFLKNAVVDASRDGETVPEVAPGETRVSRLAPIPVFGAGLIDGINPCAFTTLLFLLSTLTVVGRSRREVFLIGVVFSLAVFITYFAVGLGFFTVVRTASAFPVLALIIRWILFAILVVFASMSFYDAWLARQGRSKEILLQLPNFMKKRIHSTIRSQSRASSIVFGTLLMGFLVSLFELACTGQVYLPTITYMVQAEGSMTSYGLLILYNVGFIIPLLIVFGLVYAGTGSMVLANAFKKSLSGVKIALGVVFVALAVLTVVT